MLSCIELLVNMIDKSCLWEASHKLMFPMKVNQGPLRISCSKSKYSSTSWGDSHLGKVSNDSDWCPLQWWFNVDYSTLANNKRWVTITRAATFATCKKEAQQGIPF